MEGKRFRIRRFLALPIFLATFLLTGNGMNVSAAETRLGYVDLQKAVSGTKEWKKAFAAFKKNFQKEKSVINSKEKKVAKLLEDLNKQGFVLSPDLKKKKEEQFRKEKRELERYVQDQNESFAKKEKEMTERILRRMIDVLKKIGEEKKYTMIMEKKTVLYIDQKNDLTKLAIKTYDRTYR